MIEAVDIGGEHCGSGVAPPPASSGSGVDVWSGDEAESLSNEHLGGNSGMRSDLERGAVAVRTQAEVAEILGITQQQVAREEARALRKLRANVELARAFSDWKE